MQTSLTNPSFLKFSQVEFEEDSFLIEFCEIAEKTGIQIKRIYFLESKESPSIRGNHAHLNQAQIFLKLSGKIILALTDSLGNKSELTLDNEALFVPENYWIELKFEAESKLLCLASKSYAELKTISNKNEFLNQK